eukprot:COSAG02_NODE_1182_length_14021_cov_4.502442_9_plen_323_part_00
MPSSSRRSDEPPLSHEQSQLAGTILKKKFDPALGSDQLKRETKFMLVELVNSAFEEQGYPKRYSLTKLDCWTSNALYRWRCNQKQRRPLSWQPKSVVAAAKKTVAKPARRDEPVPPTAGDATADLQKKDSTRAACNHTPPKSSGEPHARLSPVFDTAPGARYNAVASLDAPVEHTSTRDGVMAASSGLQLHGGTTYSPFSAQAEGGTAWLPLPEYVPPQPRQPVGDVGLTSVVGTDFIHTETFGGSTSPVTTDAEGSQYWYENEPSETMSVDQQTATASGTNRSHVFRGSLSDHSGCVIIDEPVLHPPASINESSDWEWSQI